MVLGLGSFMESYNSNIQIKDGGDLANIFEGVEPCTYEEAIETFFEAQYSVEAMAVLTENAVMMESAGTVSVVNEGIVGSFVSAAIEKIKECATKVKQFAVACFRKIQDFFKQLYNKATPIDKVMQMWGKKPVDHGDIKTAMANGFKIPGSLKILTGDAEGIADDIIEDSMTAQIAALTAMYSDIEEAVSDASDIIKLGEEKVKKRCEDIKDAIAEQKERDKEYFTWIGRMLSDNEVYSKKNMAKSFIRTANEDKSKDGDLTAQEWKIISDYALNGQAKQRKYRSQIEEEAKYAIKVINDVAKDTNKFMSDAVKEAPDDKKEEAGKAKAIGSLLINTLVVFTTYLANRSVMVMNKAVLPLMRKMHTSAIGTYIYITNGTKSKNKKAEKKAGVK